jgi:DNA polymerase-3 subunit gamma/tau
MRDALSILDRLSGNEIITVDAVAEGSGLSSRHQLFELISAIADGNSKLAVGVIRELHSRSKDMVRICEELTLQFRNIMVLYMDRTLLEGVMPGEEEMLGQIAHKISLNEVLKILDTIGNTHNNLFKNVNKVVEMEMCVIKCCYKSQNLTYSVNFTQQIQNTPQSLSIPQNQQVQSQSIPQIQPQNIPQPQQPVQSPVPAQVSKINNANETRSINNPNISQIEKLGTPTKNENIIKLSDDLTDKILSKIKSKTPHIAGNIKPYVSKSGEMLIYTNSNAFADFIKDTKFGYTEVIKDIVKEVIGMDFRIKVKYVGDSESGGNIQNSSAVPPVNQVKQIDPLENILNRAIDGGVKVI